MGHRMQQGGAAFRRERRAHRYVLGRHQQRALGAARNRRRFVPCRFGIERREVEPGIQAPCLFRFRRGVGDAQDLQGELSRVHP